MATPQGRKPAYDVDGASDARVAFARGDFRAVRQVAPDFVAPTADGGQAAIALFARGRLVPRTAWGSAALLVAAWIYALMQR